ncbi:hypothetical protein NM688_g6120 [Phlebia brevispora]|uniref:Uncharacterized protein n=1 Tax=Phlebia brevispora TaxID=194682 RepID=A0ACC1SJR8_9APHY|nr:hypothetical protein NM688_g6120 [Phlebia brevispora]
MEPGPIFMRLRATAFSLIHLVSLTWIVLLSVELFLRWDVSDSLQRSLVVVMLLIDTITVIMLPTLLILEFRVWLDAVRMLFLLTCHLAIAVGFTTSDPKYQCPEDTPDDEGVCRLLNMYIVLGSWVVPALLLVYSICLAMAVYLNRERIEGAPREKQNFGDLEAVTPTQAELPIMPPPRDRTSTQTSSATRYSRPSWPGIPPPPPIPENVENDDAREKDESPRSSARLSKRLPAKFF